MKRSIAKAVEAYRKRHYGKKHFFFANDYLQIRELATDPNGEIDLCKAIQISLEAGFMVGYRTAQRDSRK